MTRFVPTLGVVLVVGLTLASGLIFGKMSNRWGMPEDLVALGDKLQEIPDSFGDWRLQSKGELSEGEITTLECTGHAVRTYVNRETGHKVNAVVLVGPAMPISLHRAEICWDTRGNLIRDPRKRVTVEDTQGKNQDFWALTFETNDVHRNQIRVYYGWSDGRGWSEETERRLSAARRPYLYKMEVACPLPPGTDLKAADPCRDFLRDFVPVLGACLVEPKKG